MDTTTSIVSPHLGLPVDEPLKLQQENQILKEKLSKLEQEFRGRESIWEARLNYARRGLEVTNREVAQSNTKLSQANKELSELRDHLEKMVEARTLEFKEEQARLQASINSLNVGYIMTDIHGKIVSSNSAARYILFRPHIGTPVVKNFLEEKEIEIEDIEMQLGRAMDIRSLIQKCIHDGKPATNIEIPLGNMFLKFFLTPILMHKEELEVIGTVILIEDITEAKVIERSRDEFFSIASHELRTPLTAIQSYAALIQMRFDHLLVDSDLKHMIEDIRSASTRLTEIVNDFLEVSRLEQGRIKITLQKTVIANIIVEVIKEVESIAKEKNVTLSFENPFTPVPELTVDPNRLKQVLVNLIGNALKFTDKGSITIREEVQGDKLFIFVDDTGRGIPEKNKNLLFRKFQQAGSSIYARDTTQGTGLGLYISKLLTNAMGGEIRLERSELDVGTEFSIHFPLDSV